MEASQNRKTVEKSLAASESCVAPEERPIPQMSERETSTLLELVQPPKHTFSIGICVTGSSPYLSMLLDLISSEKAPEGSLLKKIIVVASACGPDTMQVLKSFARRDERFVVIHEDERDGKADAINKIIDEAQGEILLFVNGDALPSRGAISELLKVFQRDQEAGIVSGRPVFEGHGGPTSAVLNLIWTVHNYCSLELNHRHVSNHASDELIAVRRELLATKLPSGIVNDGAYMAAIARLNGFAIKFCDSAHVKIDVPNRIIDLISQRRRILFGHFQVWKLTGSAPKTFESLLLFAPFLGLGVAVRTLATFPSLLKAVPLAIVSEGVSFLLALNDQIKSTNRHRVWKRYDATIRS